MTRINTIHPKHLTNEWLMAEHRELLRIPNKIISGKTKLDKKRIPSSFRMGTGHEIFFHDKLKWLHERHNQIIDECLKRGINISKDVVFNYEALPPVAKMFFYNDWKPNTTDHSILIERLTERFMLRKKAYHLTENNVKKKLDCSESWDYYYRKNLIKYLGE